jgi:ATP-dependent exoDNAse (exonuclease V) beta subunit
MTIEHLLQASYRLHFQMLRPHGRQYACNIRKVVTQAWAFERQRHLTFHDFVNWMKDMVIEGVREPDMPVADESDAVNMLTVHKSKGLEFPIVILANLGTGRVNRTGAMIMDHLNQSMAFRVGLENSVAGIETGNYLLAAETEARHDTAELGRLFYVAATRARHRLIVPVFKGRRSSQAYLNTISSALPHSLDEPGQANVIFLKDLDMPASERLPFLLPDKTGKTDRAVIRERNAWICMDKNARQTADKGFQHMVPSRNHDMPVRHTSPFSQKEALLIGNAVHDIMEHIQSLNQNQVRFHMNRIIQQYGLSSHAKHVEQLIHRICKTSHVQAAFGCNQMMREVPFTLIEADQILSGRMDMVYEKNDKWTIVDYKTDHIPKRDVPDHAKIYHPQADAYRKAFIQLTHIKEVDVVFIFAFAGVSINS